MFELTNFKIVRLSHFQLSYFQNPKLHFSKFKISKSCKFQHFKKFGTQTLRILRYGNNICQGCSHIFLVFFKYFDDTPRVQIWSHFWSVQRSSKKYSICPGIKMCHFGIIKTPKNRKEYNERPRKNKK